MALWRGRALVEGLENVRPFRGRNPRAFIGYLEDEPRAATPRPHMQRRPLWRKAYSITDKIRQRALQNRPETVKCVRPNLAIDVETTPVEGQAVAPDGVVDESAGLDRLRRLRQRPGAQHE